MPHIVTDAEGRVTTYDPSDREGFPSGLDETNFHEWKYLSGVFTREEETGTADPGARLQALEEQNALLTDCILELSEKLYGA